MTGKPRLLDPIERGELRVEMWADENIRGDSFKCECGKWCKLIDGEALSPDPYAQPWCPNCVAVEIDSVR